MNHSFHLVLMYSLDILQALSLLTLYQPPSPHFCSLFSIHPPIIPPPTPTHLVNRTYTVLAPPSSHSPKSLVPISPTLPTPLVLPNQSELFVFIQRLL